MNTGLHYTPKATSTAPTPSAFKKSVLVVEDDPFWQRVIERNILNVNAGTNVKFATTAEEAMDLIMDSNRYDLIISDHYLAGSDTGMDFWKACQSMTHQTPFILTSGSSVPMRGSGGVEPLFLAKPFTVTGIRPTLQRLLMTAAVAEIGLVRKPIMSKDMDMILKFGLAAVALTAVQVTFAMKSISLPTMPSSVELEKALSLNAPAPVMPSLAPTQVKAPVLLLPASAKTKAVAHHAQPKRAPAQALIGTVISSNADSDWTNSVDRHVVSNSLNWRLQRIEKRADDILAESATHARKSK